MVLFSELLSIATGAAFGLYAVGGDTTRKVCCALTGVLFAVGIIVTGSRSALFACVCGLFFLFREKAPANRKKSVSTIGIIGLIVLLFAMFAIRPSSAIGRIYIWRVCIDMMLERPFLGFGWNGFVHNYMRYQADFLSAHPHSSFARYADNVAFPYNEFIHTTISFGIIGLIVLLAFLCNVLFAPKKTNKDLILRSLLINYIVFSSFSYPSDSIYTCILLPALMIFSSKRYFARVVNCICFVIIIVSLAVFIKRESLIKDVHRLIVATELREKDDIIHQQKFALHMFPEYTDLLLEGVHRNDLSHYCDLVIDCAANCPNTVSYCRAGDVVAECGDVGRAIHYYDSAANMVPRRIIPKYKAFCALMECGQYERAKECGLQIIEMDLKVKSSEAIVLINDVREKMKEL